MRIALSSAAAPTASLADLIDGCTRRGLDALHLIAGHGHGIDDGVAADTLLSAKAASESAGVRIVAYEVPPDGNEDAAQRICRGLGAMLVREGAVLNAAHENVAEAADKLFAQNGDLRHIILRGGGPEAAQFEGRGIGTLMARLALRSYSGVLALAPSSTAVLPVWRTWLQRGRNWGCGSKAADSSLVQLG